MRTQCNSKPLEFEGHCSRRRLVAKKLIFLLVFLRVPSWSFVPLRGYSFLRAPSWIESQRFLPLVRDAGQPFLCSTSRFTRQVGTSPRSTWTTWRAAFSRTST